MPRPFTEAEREKFLEEKHIAVLSVATDDGRPPASFPIWYDYTPGGTIRVNTDASRRKAKFIKQTGAVTLVVQREEPPYQHVIIEGTVVDATEPSPLEARETLGIRYLGEKLGREYASRIGGPGSVLFTIRPDRWTTMDSTGEF